MNINPRQAYHRSRAFIVRTILTAAALLEWVVSIVVMVAILSTAARAIGKPLPAIGAPSPVDLGWLVGAYLALAAAHWLGRRSA